MAIHLEFSIVYQHVSSILRAPEALEHAFRIALGKQLPLAVLVERQPILLSFQLAALHISVQTLVSQGLITEDQSRPCRVFVQQCLASTKDTPEPVEPMEQPSRPKQCSQRSEILPTVGVPAVRTAPAGAVGASDCSGKTILPKIAAMSRHKRREFRIRLLRRVNQSEASIFPGKGCCNKPGCDICTRLFKTVPLTRCVDFHGKGKLPLVPCDVVGWFPHIRTALLQTAHTTDYCADDLSKRQKHSLRNLVKQSNPLAKNTAKCASNTRTQHNRLAGTSTEHTVQVRVGAHSEAYVPVIIDDEPDEWEMEPEPPRKIGKQFENQGVEMRTNACVQHETIADTSDPRKMAFSRLVSSILKMNNGSELARIWLDQTIAHPIPV